MGGTSDDEEVEDAPRVRDEALEPAGEEVGAQLDCKHLAPSPSPVSGWGAAFLYY
jgi:hypothetical protein